MADEADTKRDSSMSQLRQRSKPWMVFAVVLLVGGIGFVVYFFIFKAPALDDEIVFRSSDYPSTTLVVCLDSQQTIVIGEFSPYDFGTADVADDLYLPLAYHYLEQKGGNFRLIRGTNTEYHHIDRGEC